MTTGLTEKEAEERLKTNGKNKLEEKKNQVTQIRTNIENNINSLIEMSSEEAIKKEIEKEGLSAKYVDIYNEVMIGSLSNKLEKENLNLDESVELFEEGMELSKQASEKLENAEKRITQILDPDGVTEEPFTVD